MKSFLPMTNSMSSIDLKITSIHEKQSGSDTECQDSLTHNTIVVAQELYLPVSTGNTEVPLCSQGIMLVGLSNGYCHTYVLRNDFIVMDNCECWIKIPKAWKEILRLSLLIVSISSYRHRRKCRAVHLVSLTWRRHTGTVSNLFMHFSAI